MSIYRKDINGLRAIAVISVIVNHFNNEILPSGFLGVDVFFVISGYLITSSLLKQDSENLKNFLIDFYVRRVKRLVPALGFFVLITSLLISFFDPSPEASIKTGLFSLFGLSNFYLANKAADYFADSSKLNVFTHTWSLGVEEQFYIFFPFLIWLLAIQRISLCNFYILIGALSFISFCAFYTLSINFPHLSFYSMPTRFWELAIGAITFIALKNNNYNYDQLMAHIISITSFFLISIAFFLPEEFSTQSTMLAAFSTALFLFFTKPKMMFYYVLARNPFAYIGLISYSLYLWHWGILSVSMWTIGINARTIPFQIILILMLSVISYHIIEKPLRRASWSNSKAKILIIAVSGLIVVASLLFLMLKPFYGKLYTGEPAKLIASGPSTLTNTYSIPSTNTIWNGTDCVLASNADVGKKILIENCTLGNFNKSQKRVVVIGSSFSAAFVQAFDKLVSEDNYSITITSSWDASPVKNIINNGKWNKANDYYFDEVIPQLISELKSGDIVFMANDLTPFSEKIYTSRASEKLHTLRQGLVNFSKDLNSKGIKLAVLDSNPFIRDANCKPTAAIKQWFDLDGYPSRCALFSKDETIARRANLHNMLSNLEDQNYIILIDLLNIFCPEDVCGYQLSDGTVMYRDEWSHPSVEAARHSSTIIREKLKSY